MNGHIPWQFQVDNFARGGSRASEIGRFYSRSESFGWRSRWWYIITVCISFVKSDWNVICDDIYSYTVIVHFLHVFAIPNRRIQASKKGVSYWNAPCHLMSGLVVFTLPGSVEIHHIVCLSTVTSDFTPKIIDASRCLILGSNYTKRLFPWWSMTFPLTHKITEIIIYLLLYTFIATHTMH